MTHEEYIKEVVLWDEEWKLPFIVRRLSVEHSDNRNMKEKGYRTTLSQSFINLSFRSIQNGY